MVASCHSKVFMNSISRSASSGSLIIDYDGIDPLVIHPSDQLSSMTPLQAEIYQVSHAESGNGMLHQPDELVENWVDPYDRGYLHHLLSEDHSSCTAQTPSANDIQTVVNTVRWNPLHSQITALIQSRNPVWLTTYLDEIRWAAPHMSPEQRDEIQQLLSVQLGWAFAKQITMLDAFQKDWPLLANQLRELTATLGNGGSPNDLLDERSASWI